MRRSLLVLSVLVCVFSLAPIAARADSAVGWINVCPFDHRSMDDPIVYPGSPGASHLHDFFGNKTTDASSTYRSLLRGGTSCDMDADRAAYWAPALKFRGRYRKPTSVKFYYRTLTTPVRAIRPYPRGLKIVAGNSHATHRQSTKYVSWGCGDKERDHPIDCGRENLVAHINFPDCWDGQRTDSSDHQRHMAYAIKNHAGNYVCPRSHPVPVPRLIVRIEWSIHNGRRIRLSSGPYYTLHADFFNAWRQRRLAYLVRHCIDAGRNCGTPGGP